MKRLLIYQLLAIALIVAAGTLAEAQPRTAADVTLGDIAKATESFRNGVIVGIFITIDSTEAVVCGGMMSPNILRAGIEAALQANEITPEWTVVKAAFYVLARSGCKAVPQPRLQNQKEKGLL